MAVVDNTDAQSGDQHYGNVAGRDVRQGADADKVLDFLREYVVAADQVRETTIKELRREIRILHDDVHIVSDAVRTLRERLDDVVDDQHRDRRERAERQLALDIRLAALALLIVVVAVALALLYHDTYALATLGRYLVGATLVVVVLWRRVYAPGT